MLWIPDTIQIETAAQLVLFMELLRDEEIICDLHFRNEPDGLRREIGVRIIEVRTDRLDLEITIQGTIRGLEKRKCYVMSMDYIVMARASWQRLIVQSVNGIITIEYHHLHIWEKIKGVLLGNRKAAGA